MMGERYWDLSNRAIDVFLMLCVAFDTLLFIDSYGHISIEGEIVGIW